MEIRTVRKAGDPGTQKLLTKYGERLVCIRFVTTVSGASATRPSNSSSPRKTGNHRSRIPKMTAQHNRHQNVTPPGGWGFGSVMTKPNCVSASKRPAVSGIHPSACGSCRKKKYDGWDWFSGSQNSKKYYIWYDVLHSGKSTICSTKFLHIGTSGKRTRY